MVVAQEKTSAKTSQHSSKITVYVNESAITEQDIIGLSLLKLMGTPDQNNQQLMQRLRPMVINELISIHLQLQFTQKLKLTVHEKELNQALEEMARDNHTTWAKMKKEFISKGVNPSLIEHMIKAQMLWRQYIQGRFAPRVRITNEDIKEIRQKIKKDAKKNQVNLSQIVVYDKLAGNKDLASSTIATVHDLLKRFEDFSLLAKKHSQSPSKENGGELGWVLVDDLSPNVQRFVQKANVGDVSPPIRINGGFAIYQINDKKGPQTPSIERALIDLLQVTIDYEKTTKSEEELHQILEELMEKTTPKDIKKIGSIHGIDVQEIHQTSFHGLNLPKPLKSMIFTAKPKKFLPPMNTGKSLILFFVVSKSFAQEKDSYLDNEQIKQHITQSKLSDFSNAEMNRLKSIAFISHRS